MKSWRIVLRANRHWAVCGNCGWECPSSGCCGSTAVNAANARHTNCRAETRAA